LILLSLSFLLISCVYSMAGFGGGSSYLAILSFFAYDFHFIRTHSLLCNIAVVSIGCFIAYREGKLHLKKAVPYVLFSVPAAFLGAQIKLSEKMFFIILGFALVFAALALFSQNIIKQKTIQKPQSILMSSNIGGGIGLISGLVGIGGGIFLSPIMNLFNWENARNIAGISGFFILINSVSSLSGLMLTDSISSSTTVAAALLIPVIIGGYIGTILSIKKIDDSLLKRITGFLV
jgi:uncharacterized membrane protein YfcA